MIRNARREDAPQIADIYGPYVASTAISFEEAPVSASDMADRMEAVQALALPWLVAELDGVIAGYAYATPWKARHAYRHSVEITVYLRQTALARGLGTALYNALFDALQQRPVHAVVACIALPNAHSVALHEKFGMRKVAHFAEVGYKLGAWRDVGYWQVNLDKDVY
jgi:L-amino acid N-acyltransferase YncA